jgi:anti-sigma B factor antagonist
MTSEHGGSNFECSVNQADGYTLIRPSGWLDAFAASEFRQTMARVPSSSAVVVDLTHVKFIDSTGIGVLVALIRRVRERGSVTAVAVPRQGIRRLLQDVGFGRIALIADSAEDAARMVGPA